MADRLFKHHHQRPSTTHRSCKAASDLGESSIQPSTNGSSVRKRMTEDKKKLEKSKDHSKSEPPIRRVLVFPPKETIVSFIPFEKSHGVQQSRICSINDNNHVVSKTNGAN